MSNPLTDVVPHDCKGSKSIKLLLPPSATETMIGFLAENGIFELRATSRVSREAILMALGIARNPCDINGLARDVNLFYDNDICDKDNQSSKCSSKAAHTNVDTLSTVTNDVSSTIETEESNVLESSRDQDIQTKCDRSIGLSTDKLLEYQHRGELAEHKLTKVEALVFSTQEEVKSLYKQNIKLSSSLKLKDNEIRYVIVNIFPLSYITY